MKNNTFLYEGTDKCLVDGIKRFPLGHNGIYKDGNLSFKRYWNTLDHLVTIPETYEAQVEKFRELFFDACKIRMRSDVTMGTALSGGLDSSATISAMAHLSKGQIDYGKKDWQHAFVASFPGTPLDESNYARMVTDHIGIKPNFIDTKLLIIIAIFIGLLSILAYVFLIGAVIGLVLFGYFWLKNKLLGSKSKARTVSLNVFLNMLSP